MKKMDCEAELDDIFTNCPTKSEIDDGKGFVLVQFGITSEKGASSKTFTQNQYFHDRYRILQIPSSQCSAHAESAYCCSNG